MRKVMAFLLVLLMPVLLLSGCGGTAGTKEAGTVPTVAKAQKQKITDLVGREVELSVPVQKIVAIGPGALRLVTYAEGASMVVGFNRWNYNAIDSGEETAKGLGVEVEKTRLWGMFFSALITATVVSFLGIIAFIGLVAPHLMKRLIGGDNRFLIPASGVMGALLLLAADTLSSIAPLCTILT